MINNFEKINTENQQEQDLVSVETINTEIESVESEILEIKNDLENPGDYTEEDMVAVKERKDKLKMYMIGVYSILVSGAFGFYIANQAESMNINNITETITDNSVESIISILSFLLGLFAIIKAGEYGKDEEVSLDKV